MKSEYKKAVLILMYLYNTFLKSTISLEANLVSLPKAKSIIISILCSASHLKNSFLLFSAIWIAY